MLRTMRTQKIKFTRSREEKNAGPKRPNTTRTLISSSSDLASEQWQSFTKTNSMCSSKTDSPRWKLNSRLLGTSTWRMVPSSPSQRIRCTRLCRTSSTICSARTSWRTIRNLRSIRRRQSSCGSWWSSSLIDTPNATPSSRKRRKKLRKVVAKSWPSTSVSFAMWCTNTVRNLKSDTSSVKLNASCLLCLLCPMKALSFWKKSLITVKIRRSWIESWEIWLHLRIKHCFLWSWWAKVKYSRPLLTILKLLRAKSKIAIRWANRLMPLRPSVTYRWVPSSSKSWRRWLETCYEAVESLSLDYKVGHHHQNQTNL